MVEEDLCQFRFQCLLEKACLNCDVDGERAFLSEQEAVRTFANGLMSSCELGNSCRCWYLVVVWCRGLVLTVDWILLEDSLRSSALGIVLRNDWRHRRGRSCRGVGRNVLKFVFRDRACRLTLIDGVLGRNGDRATCVGTHRAWEVSWGDVRRRDVPEIEIVNWSLLIAHVDVEREKIDWCESSSAQDFHECWKPVSLFQLSVGMVVCVIVVIVEGHLDGRRDETAECDKPLIRADEICSVHSQSWHSAWRC